jgi:hypothetical protein
MHRRQQSTFRMRPRSLTTRPVQSSNGEETITKELRFSRSSFEQVGRGGMQVNGRVVRGPESPFQH